MLLPSWPPSHLGPEPRLPGVIATLCANTCYRFACGWRVAAFKFRRASRETSVDGPIPASLPPARPQSCTETLGSSCNHVSMASRGSELFPRQPGLASRTSGNLPHALFMHMRAEDRYRPAIPHKERTWVPPRRNSDRRI